MKALTELELAKVTHRSISPKTIQLPADMTTLILTDLTNMCDADDEVEYEQGGVAPYCSLSFLEHNHFERSDPAWDTWSVGVIILEILLGSEFVLLAHSR